MMKNRPYKDLNTTTFLKKSKEEHSTNILLDVRTQQEYEEFHLPNAILIDIKNEDFIDEINDLDQEKNYYIYCSIGIRSANACRYMANLGFTNLYNLQPGIKAYKEELNQAQQTE